MSTLEHLSALISKVPRHYEGNWCHGVKLMNAHQLSWVLLAPWCHAHECSWILMSAHECSWAAMSIHEQPWAYMSMVPWSLMCTNECALALEHSYSLMRTHIKQPWALMSIAQRPQKHSWVLRSIRDYSTMVPLKLIAPWHHSDQCLRVLRSAHGGSWMFMGALECSWVFLSDPECSSSWFSDKWKC